MHLQPLSFLLNPCPHFYKIGKFLGFKTEANSCDIGNEDPELELMDDESRDSRDAYRNQEAPEREYRRVQTWPNHGHRTGYLMQRVDLGRVRSEIFPGRRSGNPDKEDNNNS
eukprot:g7251.t1